MAEITEAYRKIGDPEDNFDLLFWQRLGPEAIFRAALDLVQNTQIVREGYADEPRLQRTIEHFQKL